MQWGSASMYDKVLLVGSIKVTKIHTLRFLLHHYLASFDLLATMPLHEIFLCKYRIAQNIGGEKFGGWSKIS